MKIVYWIFGILFFIYLAIVCVLYFAQESILFQDEKLADDYEFKFNSNFEELFIQTKDGGNLNALHFKAENPKGLIVYFHGNAGALDRWGYIAENFVQLNQDVLIVDYRGYGKSKGRRSSKLMYEDANLVYQKASEWFPENDITVYGRSLGGTFASYVASKNKPKQLILETPFYSLKSIVSGRYPLLPSNGLLKYKFPSYEFIPNVDARITFFHGTQDIVVPYDNGFKLFESSPNANLITIEGGGHNDLGNYPEYWEEIKKLFP